MSFLFWLAGLLCGLGLGFLACWIWAEYELYRLWSRQ